MGTIRARAADYLELTKARLNSLVLMTTFVGFYQASSSSMDYTLLFHALFGTSLIASSALVLNQVLERDNDSRMERTSQRPVPTGRIGVRDAAVFGLTLGLLGALYLALWVNPLTSLLGIASFVTYLFIYTPMKPHSSWNTVVGAISGALPPVMGWTAVRNELGIEAWLLFGILFFWQHPHFFALAWRYREDYARGGFKMVGGDHNARHVGVLMVVFCLGLIPLSLALTWVHLTGTIYLAGSLLLGLIYLVQCFRFARHQTDREAMKVFLTSLLYLPLLIALMMFDKVT